MDDIHLSFTAVLLKFSTSFNFIVHQITNFMCHTRGWRCFLCFVILEWYLLDWPPNNFLAHCKSVNVELPWYLWAAAICWDNTCSHSSCTGPCLHHDTFFALQSKNSSKSLSSLLLLFSSCDCFWRLLFLETFSWIILCLSRKESARK